MKSIYNIYEASLLGDIEDTLNSGKYLAEMYGWLEEFKKVNEFPETINDFIKNIKKNGGEQVKTNIEHGNFYVKITHYAGKKIDSYNVRFYWPIKEKHDIDWQYLDVFRKKVNPEYEYMITDGTTGYQNLVYVSYNEKFSRCNITSLKPAKCKKPDSCELYLLPEKYSKLINLLKEEGKNKPIYT